MKNATLRQLKVFEAVARHLSFTRAAEELHLTQPAVSTQVKALEEHSGVPLLKQLGRRIFLTDAGTEMLHHSRVIIQQFREIEVAMQFQKGIPGRLNVAVVSAGDYFFPRLLAAFIRRHPGVVPNLTVLNRTDLLRELAENRADLAIMGRPPKDADTVHAAFAPQPYVIVAAANHPLAARHRIPMSVLCREPFLVREKGSDTAASMAEGFGRWLSKVPIAMEIRSTETIKQAVIAGLGIAFLSAHTVAQERQIGSLVVLDVEGFPLMLNWYVVHRKQKRLPPIAAEFVDFLLAEGDSMLEDITRLPPAPMRAAKKPAARSRAVGARKQSSRPFT